jgi:asparagine synthase (glutamine-hydrolysing)
MSNRGPDGSQSWFSPLGVGEVGIGHNRLSIIDLTHGGNQPMHTKPERFTLSFNGEIYNYVELRNELIKLGVGFTTDSDTEVLLSAWQKWGAACLQKLNGMFAFAIYDSRDQVLTLARDRNGMKPLYFAKKSDLFVFASEPSVVASFIGKPSPNHQKVYEYLTMGLYDLDHETFFNNVYTLEPGSIARVKISNSQLNVEIQEWFSSDPPNLIEISFDSAVETVRTLFFEAVNLHLRADVPVGIALSGGIDSSGIVGAIRKLYSGREIHTFSFESPGFKKDESDWARRVSQALKTEHHFVQVSPEEAGLILQRVVREQGEPTNSSSVVAQSQLYKAVSENGFKVLLDGQGADELFAGYQGFVEFRLRSLFSQNRYLDAARLIRNWQNYYSANSILKLTPLLAATYISGKMAGYGARVVGRGAYPNWIRDRQLTKKGATLGIPKLRGYPVWETPNSQFLQNHLFESLSGGDLRRLLRHGDRSSMAHSVESRFPYLEKNLVKFVNSLPENFLLGNNGETKHILRKALYGLVPPEVIQRKDKIGFETPQEKWIQSLDFSKSDFLEAMSLFEWINLDILWSKTTKVNSGALRWRVINLCAWIKEFT